MFWEIVWDSQVLRLEEGGVMVKGEGRKDLEQQAVGPQINFLT